MRGQGLDFDGDRAGSVERSDFSSSSFTLVPGQCPRILEPNNQNLFSQAVEMISADVTRQSCAEVNVLDGTQEGKLPTLDRKSVV